MTKNPDRIIHEPIRLRIMMILSGVDEADFKFMVSATGTTKGNLSAHVDCLEKAGYIEVHKSFNGKIPNTRYSLTKAGKTALAEYWATIDEIRAMMKGK